MEKTAYLYDLLTSLHSNAILKHVHFGGKAASITELVINYLNLNRFIYIWHLVNLHEIVVRSCHNSPNWSVVFDTEFTTENKCKWKNCLRLFVMALVVHSNDLLEVEIMRKL